MIFLRCLGRTPNPRELAYLTTAHTDLVELKVSEKIAATEAGDSNDDPKLAAMTAVARIIMNLDEFVTRD